MSIIIVWNKTNKEKSRLNTIGLKHDTHTKADGESVLTRTGTTSAYVSSSDKRTLTAKQNLVLVWTSFLCRVEERRSPKGTIKAQQRKWMGHILKGDSVLRAIVEGRMEEDKWKGRPQKTLKEWMMKDGYSRLKQRDEWWLWNVRTCQNPKNWKKSQS